MNIRPVGGVWWRIGTDGNLTAFDPTGAVVAKFNGGKFLGKLNRATNVSNAPITNSTSLTFVAIGRSMQITPLFTGTVQVTAVFENLNNTVAGDGVGVEIYQSNGSNNPAGGAVPDGTQLFGGVNNHTSAIANAHGTITLSTIVTGLAINAAVTFELAAEAIIGGTASFSFTAPFAMEI